MTRKVVRLGGQPPKTLKKTESMTTVIRISMGLESAFGNGLGADMVVFASHGETERRRDGEGEKKREKSRERRKNADKNR